MVRNQAYDLKQVAKCVLWIGVIFALMRYTKGIGFAVVIPMVFWGLMSRKTEMLFFWLLVSVCTLIANSNLVIRGTVFSFLQRGMMVSLGGVMALKVFGSPQHKVIKPFLFMVVYVLFMILPSAVGWCPIISFLKLLLFTCIYFAYLGIANQVAMRQTVSSRGVRGFILAVAVVFVLGSMALLRFPAIGQLKPEEFLMSKTATSLFMGMTNQPQCLGPVISSISVVLFADLLFSIKRMDKLYLLLLACCPYLIYKTSSRTGMGAYLLGMMFVAYFFMRTRGVGSRWKSRVMSLLFIVASLGAIGLMFSKDAVRKFALKTQAGTGVSVSAEAVLSSRQALIDSALANFRKSPFIGNGFQVSEAMQEYKGGFSILSAPVEKGVWFAAILEEGGLVGMFIFCIFLLIGIVGSLRKKAYMGASCLFVCMLTNLGEFTFFSMSYSGGFIWAMVFAGLAFDARRIRDTQLETQMRQRQLQMRP